MSTRIAASTNLVLCAVLTASTVVLGFLTSATRPEDQPAPVLMTGLVALLAFPAVGALVVSRQPRNTIGWLFCAAGLWFSAGAFGSAYAGYGLLHAPGSLPAPEYAGWVSHSTFQSPATFSLLTFVLLLFPHGRPLSARWRRFAWFAGTATVALALFVAFLPGRLAEVHPPTANPLGIGALAAPWTVLELPLFLGVVLAVPAAGASMVLRFRRSHGVERQQLKWFAGAGVLLALVVGSAPVIFANESLWWVWPVLFFPAVSAVPIAAGIAILRYRLYEIDRIISRTVSYGLVTALLLGAYLGLVVLLQQATRPFTGGSDLAVAASTLIVAAAFVPVRRGVQNAVDRRFNRARYDAARTIEAFSARLREKIDLDALKTELEDVVSRTMHPDAVVLWLPQRRAR